jgi:hypothetical protein
MFVRNPRLSKSAQNTAPASKNQGSGPPGKQKNLMNCSGNQLKKQVLLKCASADHTFPILQTFSGIVARFRRIFVALGVSWGLSLSGSAWPFLALGELRDPQRAQEGFQGRFWCVFRGLGTIFG